MFHTVGQTMIGDVISGKYLLRRSLGRGSIGEVFEAQDEQSGRSLAVQVLEERYTDRLGALEARFASARFTEAIRQSSICAITEVCASDDGRPCLVMPLLKGRSLAAELEATGGRLSSDRAIDIFYQVASTLQHTHDSGVVHLGLKPSSLFLTDLGTRADFVKILDFGLAEALVDPEEPPSGIHSAWAILGQPAFMPPEQVSGEGPLGHVADLYSTAAILYLLLTGHPPFAADDPDALPEQIIAGKIPLPGSLNGNISLPLERLLLKALSANPEDRYSSARQLKHAVLKRVRHTELKLPEYLARVGFTGALPVFDPTELGSREAKGPPPASPRSYFPLVAVIVALLSAILIAVILLGGAR